MGQNGPLGLGLEILPTGLGSKVCQNGPFYTTIKSDYGNSKFKISAPTWNDAFDLPDGTYSVSDIQDYFEYIIKKHKPVADNPPVQIYVNKIKAGLPLR